jgi:hypothetical protein
MTTMASQRDLRFVPSPSLPAFASSHTRSGSIRGGSAALIWLKSEAVGMGDDHCQGYCAVKTVLARWSWDQVSQR